MQRIALLFMFLLPIVVFSQDFESQWKEVNRLIDIHNLQETQPLINAIKAKARVENNSPEWVRAILIEHYAQTINMTRDSAFYLKEKHLLEHIQRAKPIEKAVLQNSYAMFLFHHFHNSRVESDTGFLSWEQEKRKIYIDSIIALSLENPTFLVQQSTSNWKSILFNPRNQALAPTLYHLLAYNYLDFLAIHDGRGQKKHQQLVKDLQAVNKEKEYQDAYAYLAFAPYKNQAPWETKQREQQILTLIEEHHANYNAQILVELANSLKLSNEKKKAMSHIQTALAAYPHSPWIHNAKKMEKELKKVSIELETQQSVPSDQYIPIKLNTTNITEGYIRVYKNIRTPEHFKTSKTTYDSLTYQVTLSEELVYEEQINLREFTDYNSHSTNFKINPLSVGQYKILLANNPQFKDDGEELDVTQTDLTVSNIFISPTISAEDEDNYDYQYTTLLVNRKDGLPYRNKKLKLYAVHKKNLTAVASIKTNAHGEFSYFADSKLRKPNLEDLWLFIPEEKQLVPLDDMKNIPEHLGEDEEETELEKAALLFTDRAIYRPGQELFVKAILHTKDILHSIVLPLESVQIVLKDANNQSVDTLKLTTNTYGSVHGHFRIPQKTLNGQFKLEFLQGNKTLTRKTISVEEYKKPTFHIDFHENKETYTKQDTAVFTGNVKSLSGAHLSDIAVKYNVFYYDTKTYKRINYLDTVTKTDNEGNFLFRVPLSDAVFAQQKDLTLQFEAQAINQTGEIQSANSQYRYADRPLQINFRSPNSIEEGKWKHLIVKTSNPNEHPLAAKGKVNIYKYADANIIQSNHKTFDFQTEYHILDVATYKRYFPWYYDKMDLERERSKTLVGTYTFESDGIDTLTLSKNYSYGSYLLEATSTQGRNTTKATHMLQVLSQKDLKISSKDFLVLKLDKPNYTLNETVVLNFQTDFVQPSGVYLWKITGSTKSAVTFIPLKNGRGSYTQQLTAKDIQIGTSYEVMMIQENKILTRQIEIPLCTVDRTLTIKSHTFRDKISPGTKEKWSFTIRHKDESVIAEVLASMYDTALDQFAWNHFPNAFTFSHPNPWNRIYSGWTANTFDQRKTTMTVFQKYGSAYNPAEYAPILQDFGLLAQNYDTRMKISLVGSPSAVLDEVVVVAGYGQVGKGYAIGTTKGFEGAVAGVVIRGNTTADALKPLYIIDGEIREDLQLDPNLIHEIKVLNQTEATAIYGSRAANGVVILTTKEGHRIEQLNQVQARSNLQETAFFYPTLLTDADGLVHFEFNGPEALTRWKLQLFAHSKTLQASTASFFAQTQKELMVRPNLPRYLREGDEIVLRTQIQNLSDSLQNGTAKLTIINPNNNEDISGSFFQGNSIQDFAINPKGNSSVSWTLRIPSGYPTVHIKVVGATDAFSDGEVQEIPILPNRILITDSEKIILDAGQQKNVTIATKGKDNMQLKIQVQSNPILEIIAALDYLKNYPHTCNEQTASKWYGLKMLQYLQKHYPAIKAYFNSIDPDELDTKLEENSKLSELLVEEMPWVRQIQQDKEKVKSLANLFQTNFASEITSLERKLKKAQMENGAFAWFEGGTIDTRISLRILEIFGKVAKLDPTLVKDDVSRMSSRLIQFLDQDTNIYDPKASTELVLDYLYVRSLWNEKHVLPVIQTEQLRKHINLSAVRTAQQPAGIAAKAWLVNSLYDYRIASIEVKNRITQEVIYDKERGMYWESNAGWYNDMALQGYLVEAFKQLDSTKVDQITQWIYYSKQHNHWQTTWNTVDAVYALLLANNPKDFVLDNSVKIQIDGESVQVNDQKVLGQINTELYAQSLTTDKQIEISNNNNRKIYGGIYHQYFVPLESVKSQQNELSISKRILVQRGEEWVETTTFKAGDKVKVQLTVVNNEPLTYVHLRDGRAAGFEPIYEPSGYQFRRGYYFSIKDASTNYFFDYLPKGRHVYEYEIKTNSNGVFSCGIAQLEGMYEPTVNARSTNIRVTIND